MTSASVLIINNLANVAQAVSLRSNSRVNDTAQANSLRYLYGFGDGFGAEPALPLLFTEDGLPTSVPGVVVPLAALPAPPALVVEPPVVLTPAAPPCPS